VKKKPTISNKDKKDWNLFKDQLSISTIYDKEKEYIQNDNKQIKKRKLDLHGFSLDEANQKVKDFILDSFQEGVKKILIITGKGSRSSVEQDPYRSKNMNVLLNSIPEYIKNEESLRKKIVTISKAEPQDGGEGAIYLFLKNPKKFKE